MQEHLSLDMLFEDTECVDVSFQELLQCWLRVRALLRLFWYTICHAVAGMR